MALVHVCIFLFALPMTFAVPEASVPGKQAHEQHSVSPSGKLLAADGSLMHSADVAGGSTLMRRHTAQPSVKGMSEDHMFAQPSALSNGFQDVDEGEEDDEGEHQQSPAGLAEEANVHSHVA